MCRQNCCAKSSQEEEVISPPDENLLIYCKPVRLYNILRIRSLFNLILVVSLTHGRVAVIGFFMAYTFVPVMNLDFFSYRNLEVCLKFEG
ncbi:hypothetical protein IGI04_000698 [Brassica rapa subsp. trilocularis]|uniref:Uncharacterized protein n=1 Tax=Brassica rapa subsp. trilocularis TaxID=1813537 RepID=A0ABQ7NQJ4_BRACM|nr:hypothetical protein IGI04_000698 [Brassica rapa subsp. trilocularis]